MSAFLGGAGTGSDDSGAGSTQAPVYTGTTTREQFTKPDGSSSIPQLAGMLAGGTSKTPSGGGSDTAGAPAAATAQAPTFAGLSQREAAIGQPELNAQAGAVTGSITSMASAANSSATAGAANTASAAGAGTDTGSIGIGSSSTNSGSYSGTFSTAGMGNTNSTFVNNAGGVGLVTGTANTAYVAPSTESLSATNSWLTSSIDTSKMNLAGYTGPSTASAVDTTNLAASVSAASTGAYTPNAFVNATLGDNSGTASQIRNALYGGAQAAQNAAATNNAAQGSILNAQNASAVNVAQQQGAASAATATLASTASANQAYVSTEAGALASGSPDSIAAALASPQLMAALGLNPTELENILAAEQSGQLPASQAGAELASAISGASNTGYDASSAAQANQLSGAQTGQLGTTSAGANAAATNVDPSAQIKQNQQTVDALKSWTQRYQVNGSGKDQVLYGLNSLLTSGFSLSQVMNATGMTLQQISSLAGLDPTKATAAQIAQNIASGASRNNKINPSNYGTTSAYFGNEQSLGGLPVTPSTIANPSTFKRTV